MARYFDDKSVNECPTALPDGLMDYVWTEIIQKDNSLTFDKRKRHGVCYVCGEDVSLRDYPRAFWRRSRMECPSCGAAVVAVRDYGNDLETDYVCNVASMQASEDGETIWIRFWHVVRHHPHSPMYGKDLQEIARYGIRGRECSKYVRERKEGMSKARYSLNFWAKCSDFGRIYDTEYEFYLPDNWREIVGRSSLRWSRPDEYAAFGPFSRRKWSFYPNIVGYLQQFALHPAIEKLWNAGFRTLVCQKVSGIRKEEKNCVFWDRPDLKSAIRFPFHLLRKLPKEGWHAAAMERMKVCGGVGSLYGLQPDRIMDFYSTEIPNEILRFMIGRTSPEKATAYWENARNHYTSYRDYLDMSLYLGRDFGDSNVLLPKNIGAAHDRILPIFLAQKFENAKVEKGAAFRRYAMLDDKYSWSDGKLLIRPARSEYELMLEGDALSHCVAGYAPRMKSGATNIFFIRRADKPDVPYFTMEFSGGMVRQCRTAHNDSYSRYPAVREFVARWLEEKVNNSKEIA